MYYVNALINQSDDILEQIKVIKEHQAHPEVKYYIELLDNENLSPYMRWIVDRYLFGRKVDKKPKKTYGNVKLFKYFNPEYIDKQPTYTLEIKIKVGNIVIVKECLEKGICEGMEAKVLYINIDDSVTIQYNLFGQNYIEDISKDLIGGIISKA